MTSIKRQTSNVKHETAPVPLCLAIVWLLILAFVVTFVTLSLRRHAALGSNGMDLGNVDQALWNTAHGDFLAFTNMAPVRNRLALHVEPILLLFVPFYWAGLGGPRLLLVVQAIVVGLGALPLYWLARDVLSGSMKHEVGSREGAADWWLPPQNSTLGGSYSLLPTPYSLLLIVFPLAYLLLPALEAAVMYDFHAVTLAPTFLLFAFYFGMKRRPWLFSLFVLLALASKEDMGLTVAMLGLFMMVVWRRWCWGAITVLAGVAWFVIAVFLIQPGFSPTGGNIQADRYAWLGDTPLVMIDTILRHPVMVWDHVWRGGEPAWLPGRVAAAYCLLVGPWPPGMVAGASLFGHQPLERQPVHLAAGGFSLCRTHRPLCPNCHRVWYSTAEQVGRALVGGGRSIDPDRGPCVVAGRIVGLSLCAWFFALVALFPAVGHQRSPPSGEECLRPGAAGCGPVCPEQSQPARE